MTLFDGMTNATPWPIKSAPDPGCEQISARHFLPTSALRPTWAVLADARTHRARVDAAAILLGDVASTAREAERAASREWF